MNMEKNKKILWGVVAVILLLVAFALGRESGWNQGTADVLDAIYPPADAGTAPIYPPMDYIYPPADAGTAPIYPPMDYIYPPADAGTAPIYPPTDPIYPPMP